jgi:hypothetical protein
MQILFGIFANFAVALIFTEFRNFGQTFFKVLDKIAGYSFQETRIQFIYSNRDVYIAICTM